VIEDWKRILSTSAAEWGLPADGEWNFLFHNNYQPASSTINLLWFHQNDEFPRAVTKMCREPDILTREFRTLQTVYKMAPDCAPRPLHLGCADGFWMLWMEGIPGRRISTRRHYPASMLIPALDAIATIHRGVNRGIENSTADRHARMVAAPIDAVLQCEISSAVRAGCLALREMVTADWLHALPVIPQHGDLYLDNVLCYRKECHIVDWENFGLIDLPFYDVLTLLLSFLRASGDTPDRWAPALAKEMPMLLDRYARGLQLEGPMPSALLSLTLVNRFYLHWIEKRSAAAAVMYTELAHHFEHTAFWQEVFLREVNPK
jgi:hypothetical protein